ncbi:MAG TPA: hypothetical protein VF579_00905 [Candidatus Methylomirabilis sp.]
MATRTRKAATASPEEMRLREAQEQQVPWRKWGPYLSERQWGTVGEDFSDNGNDRKDQSA